MNEPLHVWIGYDPKDHNAYRVCEHSLRKNSSVPLLISPIKDWEVRHKTLYWRSYHVNGFGQPFDDVDGKPFSTQFSFTRFLVPALENYDADWVLFCDADMLFRADISELYDIVRQHDDKSVMVIKHNHRPEETHKMDLMRQTLYSRKNWSSLIFWNVWKNHNLTLYNVNNKSGNWLHNFKWLSDNEIGELPTEWNWLEGYSNPDINPKVVHFTRGTPDFPGYEDCMYSNEWRQYLKESLKET